MKRHSMRFAPVFVALLLLLTMSVGPTAAEPSLNCEPGQVNGTENTLSENPEDQLRALNFEYYLDPTNSLEVNEIVSQEFSRTDCTAKAQSPFPDQALWLRFTVQNPHDSPKQWVVAFAETIHDDLTLYEQRQNDIVLVARDGRSVASSERASRTIKPGLPLAVEPGENRAFYLRIAGTVEPTVTPVIATPNLFSDWSTSVMISTALFLSFVLSIIVISLIIFRQVETRFYKYYALYLTCILIFSFLYDGWLKHIFCIHVPVKFLSPFMFFLTGVGVFAIIQYCRILLEIDARNSRFRFLFTLLVVAAVITTGLAVLDPWTLALPLHLSYVLNPIVLLFVSLFMIKEGVPQAKPIAFALLIFAFGLVLAVYYFIFPLEITRATFAYELLLQNPVAWGYYVAVVGETTFMMIAISVMVKAMQKQKLAAMMEAHTLRGDVTVQAEALKNSGARLDALETILTEDPNKKLLPPAEKQFLERVTECLLANVSDENFGVKELATVLATSERTLARRLKKTQGQTSAAFIRSVRLNFARDQILMRQHTTIAEAARSAGFSSVSHFSKMYRQEFNETPSGALKNAMNSTKN
ncbi:7TM-DISM domain-containing protein [Labrenzia sp. OB1]|uniref:7TM-DISM domain-containing protein n=1 Tax=Labrenzia sp. OB1 TaxID=1561204 RepID=UPI000AC1CD6E|nr:7TM-DISM domain-containing protein [Labrenzia sp. OB1]